MSFPGEYTDDAALPEAAFSLTCKSGTGYDADMLTVRGQSFDEFHANAAAVLGADMLEEKLAGLRRTPNPPQSAAQASAAANGTPAPAATPAGPAATPQAPAQGGDWTAQAPQCAHGQRRAQEWTAKSGPQAGKKQFTYFCPLGRDVPASQKCKPIDAISGKEWA